MSRGKTWVSVGLAVALLIAPQSDAFALENNQKLSASLAVTTALEQNSDLKLVKEKIKIAEKNLKTTLDNVDFYKKAEWSSGAQRQSNAKEAYLAPTQRENQLSGLNRDLASAKETLELKVLEEYYSIVKLKEDQKGKMGQLKVYAQELSNRQAEYKLGKVTALDVTKAETTVKEMTNTLSGLENDLIVAYLNLNSTMQENLDKSYTLTNELPKDQKFIVNDVTAAIKKDKTLNSTLLSSKERIVELEKEIEVVANYSSSHYKNDSSASTDTTELELSLKDAKFKVEMTDLQMGYQFKIDYNTLMNQYDQLSISQINVTIAEKSLAIAKAKLSAGTIGQVSYLTVLNDLETSKNALSQKQIDYHMALNKFKMTHKL